MQRELNIFSQKIIVKRKSIFFDIVNGCTQFKLAEQIKDSLLLKLHVFEIIHNKGILIDIYCVD